MSRKIRSAFAVIGAISAFALVGVAGPASAADVQKDVSVTATGTAAAKAALPADQTRFAPFTLSQGQSVSSATARLVLQSDGNLVIYDEFNNARWASNTVGQGWTARFQTDGNLVVYTASNKAVWDSGTYNHPGSRLVIQDDGNVVIYDGSQAIWASNTNH